MKLMIVDDHILFREGLAAIIHAEPDIEVVCLAGTVAEAIDMAQQIAPDLILMDYSLPDGSGADASREILARNPSQKIIILTVHEDDSHLLTAVRSGVRGYLLKNMRPSKLIAAVRSVYNGESAISRSMTLRVMEELSRLPEPDHKGDNHRMTNLTRRELEVLRELSLGKTNQEIASELYLSENTVKYHVHSILEKLEIKDRREAAIYAHEHHLFT